MQISIEKGFRKLYKYAMQEHVRGMLDDGVFRIGTLFEYRRHENPEIRDEEEGRKNFSFWGPTMRSDIELFLAQRPDLANAFDWAQIEKSLADGVPIGLVEDTPDTYLFCTTHTFDEQVMRAFGYDACIEIWNPTRFLTALNKTMSEHAYLSGLRRCHYVNRWARWDRHNDHPLQVMKPEHLAHQKEARFLWTSKSSQAAPTLPNPLEPIFVVEPDAAVFCKRKV